MADYLTPSERILLDNPPYTLSISHDSLIAPKRRRNNAKPPPRPSNGWILFRTNFVKKLRKCSDKPFTIQEASRLAGKAWKSQPPSVINYFTALAKEARQAHKAEYPGYNYKPGPKKTKSKKLIFKQVNADKFKKQTNNNADKKERVVSDQSDNFGQPSDEQPITVDVCEQPSSDEIYLSPLVEISQSLSNVFDHSGGEPVDYVCPIPNGSNLVDDCGMYVYYYELVPNNYDNQQQLQQFNSPGIVASQFYNGCLNDVIVTDFGIPIIISAIRLDEISESLQFN
ncbi:718_t:CDS:1 [Paraglomus occultum]|uniref:718_t:CDS:1 n=1 Tax=Paraglomus occultum TaxID=144539 RepID=A0A9N9BKP5_9GLOM|nr:718_t:CDS:1 [Paraglomus occultum]